MTTVLVLVACPATQAAPYTRLPELRARVGGALLCVYRHCPRPGRAASHPRRPASSHKGRLRNFRAGKLPQRADAATLGE